MRVTNAKQQQQQQQDQQQQWQQDGGNRRAVLGAAAAALATVVLPGNAEALGFKKDLNKSRRVKLDPSLFKDGPEGLK